jgi:transcriptional regulator with XRE-family HTH domain
MGRARSLRYRSGMQTPASPPIGDLVREWRHRRRRSQLDLACDGEISTRHLSFIETGRATPSREMLLRLAEVLDVPLRERNLMLLSAGYAPKFSERPLDDPALAAARDAVGLVLRGHEPYPAVAVDRHWTLVAANASMAPLLDGVELSLLAPPANVLRIGLHPLGLAPRIANLAEWRDHLLGRLRRQVADTGDSLLRALLDELTQYPATNAHSAAGRASRDYAGVVVPLELVTPAGTLAFFGTVTVFGTPLDVTLSELAVEAFFPADAATAECLRAMPRSGSV